MCLYWAAYILLQLGLLETLCGAVGLLLTEQCPFLSEELHSLSASGSEAFCSMASLPRALDVTKVNVKSFLSLSVPVI